MRMFAILLAAFVSIVLTGCSDVMVDRTRAEADRTRAEAQRIAAQAQATESRAQLAAVEAFSTTLAIQSTQVVRLIDQVQADAQTWRAFAVMLTGAMCLAMAVVLLAVLYRIVRAPAHITVRAPADPPYYVLPTQEQPPIHALQDPREWPEVRARRRALIDGQCRQVAVRR